MSAVAWAVFGLSVLVFMFLQCRMWTSQQKINRSFIEANQYQSQINRAVYRALTGETIPEQGDGDGPDRPGGAQD